MTRKKQIRPGEKVGLKLTTAERTLLLEGLTCLPTEYEQAITRTPDTEAVMLTLDDLDDLNGYVAAESNHTTDKRLQKKLDAMFQKIQHLLDKHTDEEPPKTFKIKDAKKAKEIADYAVQLAEAAAQVLAAAEQLHIKTKPVERFSLNDSERAVLTLLPTITTKLKKKLVQQDAQFTVAEVTSMTMAVAEAFSDAEPMQLVVLMIVAKNLLECLRGYTIEPEEPARTQKASRSSSLFQFKITLLEIKPPIWRRIQVPDCTLGDLHIVIQAAMGWQNCHLHQFIIDGVRYGVPEPELNLKNEAKVLLSQIVPKGGKGFRFRYEYDFGDSWIHDIVFEGSSPNEPGQNYPVCLKGSRACPPEDCGGPYGYPEFLGTIADPKHERHGELLEWMGGAFDPEEFDVKTATKAMMKAVRRLGRTFDSQ